MAGFDAPYIPGWDCHGLPIEIKVDQQLGGKKLQMQPLDVRLECRKYADKYLNLQREQFKRIGVLGRWDKPYSTMTPEYESVVIGTFYKFFEEGFVYKGLRPVYWCMHDRTALAEAEVEYETHTSPTVFVRYELQSDPRAIDPALADARIHKDKSVYTIIWTTTPWTLPAAFTMASLSTTACRCSKLTIRLLNCSRRGARCCIRKKLSTPIRTAGAATIR